jgi:chlorite dismutase
LGRTATDLDRTNAREAADILREVVPQLEKIRNGHSSARLRQKADHYLRRIATEMDALIAGDVKTIKDAAEKVGLHRESLSR